MRTINIYMAAFVMTGSLAGIPSANLALAEPPSQNNPSDVTERDAGKETGAQEMAPAASPPTVQEEPAQPAEAGEVQERGFGQPPPVGQLQQQLQMVGPTPNLTAVANRLLLKSKSLTTVITVPANLPLTQPVTINIWYSSPAGSDTPSRGEPYNPSTGNRFVHLDPEGDGKPRQLRMDISLLEPNPAGGFHRFSFSKQVNLDPLYDVTISPLRFGLLTTCDTLGQNSEIDFHWYYPENNPWSVEFNATTSDFQGTGPAWVTIDKFGWARYELSASHNLDLPVYWFCDDDPPGVSPTLGGGSACGPLRHVPGIEWQPPKPGSKGKLVPGKTKDTAYLGNNLRQETYSEKSHAENATGQQCQAHLQFTIKYLLRQYPNL